MNHENRPEAFDASALRGRGVSAPLHPILLCNGEINLWPLSRKAWPKHFVPLVEGQSLLALALERARALGAPIGCVGAEAHRFHVQEAMEAAHVKGHQMLEPQARGSAALMCLAALLAPPDALLLFMPADHHVPDTAQFTRTVMQGVTAARQGHIVGLGVMPGYPDTARGYLVRPGMADAEADPANPTPARVMLVAPASPEAAQALLLQGGLWNIGVYLTLAATLMAAVRTHAPDLFEACQRAAEGVTVDGDFSRLPPALTEACRSERFESAVLAHCENLCALPFPGAWSDVGNWRTLAGLRAPDADGNRLNGEASSALNAHNTFIHAGQRPVVALGTDDLLIIDTPDAVLVASAHCIDQVNDAVAALEAAGLPQGTEHRRVARPWGAYDSVDAGARFQVKRLTVKPGAKLSLQMHYHRAEHWMVVQGTARVTRDHETILLRENESIYIPLGAVHRLENPGKTLLEVIEVQSGSYLGEDDIVRFDDTYGRVAPLTPTPNPS